MCVGSWHELLPATGGLTKTRSSFRLFIQSNLVSGSFLSLSLTFSHTRIHCETFLYSHFPPHMLFVIAIWSDLTMVPSSFVILIFIAFYLSLFFALSVFSFAPFLQFHWRIITILFRFYLLDGALKQKDLWWTRTNNGWRMAVISFVISFFFAVNVLIICFQLLLFMGIY